MVVDTSVLVAISMQEPGWEAHFQKMVECPTTFVGAPALLEAAIVLFGKTGRDERQGFSRLFQATETQIVGFEELDFQAAFDSFKKFGKGIHPAGLNLGDSFSIGLAVQLDAALLFVGDDFAKTDVRSA